MSVPQVPLSKIARPISRTVEVVPGTNYRTIGVKWWGEGAYERETIDGSQTAAKTLSIVRADDLIINKIWVRHGSTAIATQAVDGCAASGEFPTFELDQTLVLPRWIHWQTKTKAFWAKCDALSQGTSGKNRIKPELFLTIEIPLPPLDEQRRVVARIEALAARIEEARGLRRQAAEEAEAIFTVGINEIWRGENGWTRQPIGNLAKVVSGQVDPMIEPYSELPHINGEAMEAGTCRLLLYRLAREDQVTSGKFHFPAGSILYSKIRPYLRKAVQVPVEGICSADVYAFEQVDPRLEPRFFMYSLISPRFTEYANTLSGRTRMPKLNQNQLFAFQLAYPPLPEQRRIVAYLDDLQAKVDGLKRLQAETAAELDALLPAVLDKAFKGEL